MEIKLSASKILFSFLLLVVFGLVFPVSSPACPIPVFRYALEYWEADDYVLEIIYENPLDPDKKVLVDELAEVYSGRRLTSNLEVRAINLSSAKGNRYSNAVDKMEISGYPWMILHYPFITGIEDVLWSGELNRDNVDLLLNSPIRKNIVEQLVKDVTAIWIFLESGDRRKDRETYEILNNELRRLEQTIVLRDPELWQRKTGEENKISQVKFEIIRLSRNDHGEQRLIQMLLNSEADLMNFESEPMVFPVFGRGILLYGIVGKGINEWNIRDAAQFITGDCSCQAKIGNPGVDLLIAADWEGQIENITDISIANPLSGMGDFSNKEEKVKRLLEEATEKRLGKRTGQKEAADSEKKKIIYLELTQQSKDKNAATTKQSSLKTGSKSRTSEVEDKAAIRNGGNENGVTLEHPAVNGANTGDEVDEAEDFSMEALNKQENRGMNTLVMVFIVFISMIFLAGLIIYLKRSKH